MTKVVGLAPTKFIQKRDFKLTDASLAAGAGAIFFSTDSYIGQKQYIKKGEEYFEKVFDTGLYKKIYKNNINKIKDTYLNIIKSKQINKKMITQAALKGSLIFAGIYFLSKKIVEHIFKKRGK